MYCSANLESSSFSYKKSNLQFTTVWSNRRESDPRCYEATKAVAKKAQNKFWSIIELALYLLPMRLHSSVGRAITPVSRRPWVWIPLEPHNFFLGFLCNWLPLLHNCEDRFHLYSLSAVHIHMIYIIIYILFQFGLNYRERLSAAT